MVQGLTLLACYLDKLSTSNTASIYLGAAVKMAMSLGFHREFPDWDISLFDREMRRRVWWCLYVLESGQSMAMGRPILLPCSRSMDISLPLNIPEQALTARTKTQPKELPGLTIYSGLIAHAEFHLMINETYNICVNSSDLRAKDLLCFNASIDSWMKPLPPHLQEDYPAQTAYPRLNFSAHHLIWRVRSLKIGLFFPFLVRRAGTESLETGQAHGVNWQEAVRVCVDYSHNIVGSIEDFFANEPPNPLRDGYGLIQAALVLILAIHSNFSFLQESNDTMKSALEKTTVLLAKVLNEDRLGTMILEVMSQNQMNASQESFVDATTAFLHVENDHISAPSFDEQTWFWLLWNEPL
ncbi:hypothetical protein TrVFT333_004728 [Trichoderma virens FT-333]|nr:hypothetical protein TrVFT333_004728 [Trichoderma virens FT-333]